MTQNAAGQNQVPVASDSTPGATDCLPAGALTATTNPLATSCQCHPSVALPDDALVHKTELIISNLLRGGVLISVALVLLGLVLMFIHHPQYLTAHPSLVELTSVRAEFPHTLSAMGVQLLHGRGQATIVLGLLVLLVTPVLRVAVSIFAFMLQRDRVFTAITTLVLFLLLLSFVLGKVE